MGRSLLTDRGGAKSESSGAEGLRSCAFNSDRKPTINRTCGDTVSQSLGVRLRLWCPFTRTGGRFQFPARIPGRAVPAALGLVAKDANFPLARSPSDWSERRRSCSGSCPGRPGWSRMSTLQKSGVIEPMVFGLFSHHGRPLLQLDSGSDFGARPQACVEFGSAVPRAFNDASSASR